MLSLEVVFDIREFRPNQILAVCIRFYSFGALCAFGIHL